MPDHTRSNGAVFYDGDCAWCRAGARRCERALANRGFALHPLQTPGAAALLGVRDERLLDEMRLRLHDGTVFGGAAAVVEIARHIWWAWPLWAVSRLPGAMRAMEAAYQWVAGRRHCGNGACAVETGTRLWPIGYLPLVVLPALAAIAAPFAPRWAFMWAMAFALYAGCKWLTLHAARVRGVASTRLRELAYLLAWPGMDATAFLSETHRITAKPRPTEWVVAVLKTLFGAAMIWAAAGAALPANPLMAGWLGMAGLIFALHFGTFHLLSLAWRSIGVKAMPVMQNPLRSTSLAEFWGRRWNTAFHELATKFTFRPLQPALGRSGATFLVFLASGLIHELVISVPARGGYGLPTGYFVLQGLGVAGERTRFGQWVGLGHGWRGWLFTVAVAAGPAFWLFPPPFVRQIIVPMLAIVSAT